MSEIRNQVTVLFRNGDSIDVRTVVRIIGAEWILATRPFEGNEKDDETTDCEKFVFHTDDIRGIVSRKVSDAGDEEINTRIHHTEEMTEGEKSSVVMGLWQAQHQLAPDADPTTA